MCIMTIFRGIEANLACHIQQPILFPVYLEYLVYPESFMEGKHLFYIS